MLVRDYLYAAAVQAEVLTHSTMRVTRIERRTGKVVEGEKTVYFDQKGERVKRFGFHQFRHSLSSFLTTKKKVDPKRLKPSCVRATRPLRSIGTRKRTLTSLWRLSR